MNERTAKRIYYPVSFSFIINQLTLAYDFLETEFTLEKLQEPTVIQEKIDNLLKVIKSVESYLNYINGSPLTTQECINLSTFTQLYVNYGKLQAFRWFSEQEDTNNDAFQFNKSEVKNDFKF